MKHIREFNENFNFSKTPRISTTPMSSAEFMTDIMKKIRIPIKQSIEEIYSYYIEKGKWALNIKSPKMKMSGYIEADVQIWEHNKIIRTERISDLYKFLMEFDFN